MFIHKLVYNFPIAVWNKPWFVWEREQEQTLWLVLL